MGKIAVVGIEPTYGHTGGGFDFAGFFSPKDLLLSRPDNSP